MNGVEILILVAVLFIIVRNFRNDKAKGRSPLGGGGGGGGSGRQTHRH